MMRNLSFISNNIKGIQVTPKRLQIFEYLKNPVTSNGFVFPQESHSSLKDEKYRVPNSKDSYSSLMEKSTPVVLPLV